MAFLVILLALVVSVYVAWQAIKRVGSSPPKPSVAVIRVVVFVATVFVLEPVLVGGGLLVLEALGVG
jgi:hypothetical protein